MKTSIFFFTKLYYIIRGGESVFIRFKEAMSSTRFCYFGGIIYRIRSCFETSEIASFRSIYSYYPRESEVKVVNFLLKFNPSSVFQ